MKKIVKGSFALGALLTLGTMNVNAKVMTAEDIEKALTFHLSSTQTASETAYVFGKHVHVNTFTMADAVAAGNTLEGQTDAILYFKNGANVWTNAITEETVNKEDIIVEMTKLIGKANNGKYVSYDDELNEEVYEQTQHYDARIEDNFYDEKSPVKIINIRKLQEVGTLVNATEAAQDTHEYNTGALKPTFTSNTLTLTETTPLLEYSRTKETSSTNKGEWFGLLIRLNKKTDDKQTATLTIGTNKTYNLDSAANEEAKKFGGSNNDYLIWVDGKLVTDGGNAVLTYTDKREKTAKTETQTIKVKYVEPKVSFRLENLETDNVEVTTEGAAVEVVEIAGKYVAVFYSTDDKKVTATTPIEYTVDGDKQSAKKGSNGLATVTDLIDVTDESFTVNDPENNKHLSISAPVASDEEDYDYIVTVTSKQVLKPKTISLDLDFGGNIKVSEDSDMTDYSVTFDENNEAIATFTNGTEVVKVKFVLVEEVDEFKLTSAGVVEKEFTHYDTKLADKDRQNVNETIKENKEKLSAPTLTHEVEKDTEGKVTEEYDKIKLLANATLTKVDDAIDYHKDITKLSERTDATYATGSKLYAIVVDFGVDRKDISYKDENGVYAVGIGENADKYTEYLESLGITGTQFLLIVDANILNPTTATKLEFTNEVSKVVDKVEIEIVERVEAKDDTNKISQADFDAMTYDKNVLNVTRGEDEYLTFTLYEDVKEFTVTIDGTEYTYAVTVTPAGPTAELERANSIKIVDVKAVSAEKITANEDLVYNQKSVADVDFTANTIKVALNRAIGDVTVSDPSAISAKKAYAILVKFNVEATKVTLTANDNVKEASSIDEAYFGFAKDTSAEDKKKVTDYTKLIYVIDNGEDIELEFKYDSTDVSQKVVVSTTQNANAKDLKVLNVKKVLTGSGNSVYNALTDVVKKDLDYNLEAIQDFEINDNVITIYVDKTALKAFTADGRVDGLQGTLLPIIVDFNSTFKVDDSADGVNKGKAGFYSSVSSEAFGATPGTNEGLVWLLVGRSVNNEEATAKYCVDETGKAMPKNKCYASTAIVENTDEENIYNTATIAYRIIDVSTPLETNTVEVMTSVPTSMKTSDNELFTINQGRYEITYKEDAKTKVNSLVINPLKATESAVEYSFEFDKDAEELTNKGNWLAIALDFDKNVTLATTDGALYKDGILMVDVTKFTDAKDLVFTSSYDTDKTFTINLKAETTVKEA